MNHSRPHVFAAIRNILITIIRFSRYHLLLASKQHFRNWFSVFRHNSYLVKLELTPSLFDFNQICDLTNRQIVLRSSHWICLYFHIRLKRLKPIYYSLISNFPKYQFKTGSLCLLFLSSHILIDLEFDSNYFVILLWKIKKTKRP